MSLIPSTGRRKGEKERTENREDRRKERRERRKVQEKPAPGPLETFYLCCPQRPRDLQVTTGSLCLEENKPLTPVSLRNKTRFADSIPPIADESKRKHDG